MRNASCADASSPSHDHARWPRRPGAGKLPDELRGGLDRVRRCWARTDLDAGQCRDQRHLWNKPVGSFPKNSAFAAWRDAKLAASPGGRRTCPVSRGPALLVFETASGGMFIRRHGARIVHARHATPPVKRANTLTHASAFGANDVERRTILQSGPYEAPPIYRRLSNIPVMPWPDSNSENVLYCDIP